MTTTLNER